MTKVREGMAGAPIAYGGQFGRRKAIWTSRIRLVEQPA